MHNNHKHSTKMKRRLSIIAAIVVLSGTICTLTASAQLYKPMYFNIDWQFNAIVGNDYADTPTGWGMNFEGGYYVNSKLAVGLYASFHTANKHIGEELLQLNESSHLYTDQIHSVFQIPFGALLKYLFVEDTMFEPYVTAKIGTMFSRTSSTTQVWEFYEEKWGFNVQPEVGVTIYPSAAKRYGIHIAAYYNYSTNQSRILTYDIDGINNVGFHLGFSF